MEEYKFSPETFNHLLPEEHRSKIDELVYYTMDGVSKTETLLQGWDAFGNCILEFPMKADKKEEVDNSDDDPYSFTKNNRPEEDKVLSTVFGRFVGFGFLIAFLLTCIILMRTFSKGLSIL